MADFLVDTQGPSASPASGKSLLYPDSVTKQWTSRDDSGRSLTLPRIVSFNAADQVANAADTYLTGSMLIIPPHLLQAGTFFKWRFGMTKTAAGIATPIWVVRVGVNGTTADTARLTFTGPAQTAAVDAGFVEIMVILRNIGAAGIMAGMLQLSHNLAVTGFANLGSPTLQVTSAAFDTTVANLRVGVSVNPGSAGVWTHQLVTGELLNL